MKTVMSLLESLNKHKVCGHSACVTLKSFIGTMVVVEMLCAQGHDYVWRSQVLSNSIPWIICSCPQPYYSMAVVLLKLSLFSIR